MANASTAAGIILVEGEDLDRLGVRRIFEFLNKVHNYQSSVVYGTDILIFNTYSDRDLRAMSNEEIKQHFKAGLDFRAEGRWSFYTNLGYYQTDVVLSDLYKIHDIQDLQLTFKYEDYEVGNGVFVTDGRALVSIKDHKASVEYIKVGSNAITRENISNLEYLDNTDDSEIYENVKDIEDLTYKQISEFDDTWNGEFVSKFDTEEDKYKWDREKYVLLKNGEEYITREEAKEKEIIKKLGGK